MKQKVGDKSLCVVVLYLECYLSKCFSFWSARAWGVDELKYAKIFPLVLKQG